MTDQDDPKGGVSAQQARRKTRRKKVLKTARLIIGEGRSTVDCIVKDISFGGARVKVGNITQLGRTLRIIFPSGEVLDADVVRENGVEFGLVFKPGARPKLAPPPDVAEGVAIEMESRWLTDLLDRLDASSAATDPEVAAATEELREAYAHLKMILERRRTAY